MSGWLFSGIQFAWVPPGAEPTTVFPVLWLLHYKGSRANRPLLLGKNTEEKKYYFRMLRKFPKFL